MVFGVCPRALVFGFQFSLRCAVSGFVRCGIARYDARGGVESVDSAGTVGLIT